MGNKQGKVIDNIAYFCKFLRRSCFHAHPTEELWVAWLLDVTPAAKIDVQPWAHALTDPTVWLNSAI